MVQMMQKIPTPIHRLIDNTDASDTSNQPIPMAHATATEPHKGASMMIGQALMARKRRMSRAQTSRTTHFILFDASRSSGCVSSAVNLIITSSIQKPIRYGRTAAAVRLARPIVARPKLIAIGVVVSLLSGALWESLATSVSR